MKHLQKLIEWLLEGDVSIQFQTFRDLLGKEKPALQKRIAREGWGKRFLAKQQINGHWGHSYYQPRWTSSHYTLLDIRNLNIQRDLPPAQHCIELILKDERGPDNGINPSDNINESDVCINGMFLNFATYFKTREEQLHPIIDFILSQRLPDGGFNCRYNRSGAVHSSLHSTISVLEGIASYEKLGYEYRLKELQQAARSSIEFTLIHQLFKSDKTGKVISPGFLRFSYPPRWYYDIMRALDYFQWIDFPWDERMQPALEILKNKQRKDGIWPLQANHPGQVHFEMEKPGKPSRWNTLRALRILQWSEGRPNS